jgi:hypothetical protein
MATSDAAAISQTAGLARPIAYPAFLKAADNAASVGQRWYIRLVRADIGLIIAGALTGALSALGPPGWQKTTAVVSAILLGTGAIMRWVNRSRRPNRAWFDGRAIAESIKTNSWRYMMRTDPFAGSDSEAEARFIGDLLDILKARQELSFPGVESGEGQITASMRLLRAEPFDVRRSTYLERRLKDQIVWYSSRAVRHQHRARLYFAIGLAAELSAVAWAIVRVAYPGTLNLIGVFTSLAVAATALSQVHSHDELGGRYAVAALELSAIRTLAESADESKFSDVVKDGEGAISREHTMWIAKRT